MKQILPHLLWLGHAGEARDIRRLSDAGIRAVVELAIEERTSPAPRELVYCRFPLLDGAGNDGTLLFLAITTVRTLLERRVQTLVCCSMGVSRAPAVAAAALAMLSGESPERCLVQIAEHHPSDVSPGLWDDLLGLVQRSAS